MAFDLEMVNPIESGGGIFHGGPGEGGHTGSDWFVAFGMDLGAPGGTEIRSVFDGKITKLDTTNIDKTTGTVFGAQIFVRAEKAGELHPDDPDGVGVFYTHLTSLTPAVFAGAHLTRGEVIGHVSAASPPHLHIALAERRGGTNFGVNLYALFQITVNTSREMTVRFFQNGDPPEPL